MRPLYEITIDAANTLRAWESAQEIEDTAERNAEIDRLDALMSAQDSEFEKKAEGYAKAIRNLEAEEGHALAEAAPFKVEMDRYIARAKAKRGQVDWLRRNLRYSMERLGLKRVAGEQLNLTLQEVKASVEIFNEAIVPAQDVEQVPKIDRQSIYNAIREGVDVPGARLVPNSTVRIR